MKKVAICGTWHVHASDYASAALKHVEVIGVWEENEARRKAFCDYFKLPVFETLDDLLNSDAEGVIVCTSTDSHADIMVKIAESGKHIFTEKVLALSEEDCDRVAAAVTKNNVNFVISLVQKYKSGPLTVKKIIDSGELGKVNYVRFRNCHSGSLANWLPAHFYSAKECGGGAMIDLGAHGMYLIDWLCGVPVTVKSIFTHSCTNEAANALNPDRVEDNAVTVMSFADGCIAVNETGFVSNHYPMTMEVGGEQGMVFYGPNGVSKRTNATNGQCVTVEMCKDLTSPIEQFLTGNILDGCGLKEAKALTHLMVEAYK